MSLSHVSYQAVQDSAAKHLEELSQMAEQLSSAQDRVSCLERERQELLGLLPESVGTSLTELAVAWNRLHDEHLELKRRLQDSVPSEDHRYLEKLVSALRSDLSDRDKIIDQTESKLNHFLNEFRELGMYCESGDFCDCVDACFSELVSTRTALKELRQEKCEFTKKLEETVSKVDFADIQHRFSLLQSEFESVSAQLAVRDDRLNQIEQLLLTEFPEQSEQPGLTITELLVAELHELRDAVDQLTHEQQVAYSLLREISSVPDPGTLTGFVEVIRQKWKSIGSDLAREVAEKEQALDLLRSMNLATVHDPNTLCGYVQACLTCLTEKQDEINRLGLLCEQTEESLRQTVPINDFEVLKLELDRVNEELADAKNELRSVESHLDDVMKSWVPCETYKSKNERVQFLEQELADIQSKNTVYDKERAEIIAMVAAKTARTLTAENWVEQIGHICDEFSAITSSMNRLHSEYELVLSECQKLRDQVAKMMEEMEENSSQAQRDHEAALTALRESLNLDFTSKLEAITTEHNQSNTRLVEELESTRSQQEQLSAKLSQREGELQKIGEKLHEAEREIGHLRDSIALHIESAKASSETAKAQERRANELASHLECLREEHRKCPAQLELINAQTSPVVMSATGDEMDAVATLRPASVELNQTRIRKYGELKAVAFEIKEKLVRRTDKLESALTEVARLRSVIQQDKEHASRILEEVEDLRKQAIRKNKRIHALEAELAQLKATRANGQPVSSARHTRSSARTLSEVEQPRGAQYRSTVPPSTHLTPNPMLMGSTAASLLQCPNTPFIDDTNADTDLVTRSDSTSLLLDKTTSNRAEKPKVDPVVDVRGPEVTGGCCKQCEKLHSLVLGMKRLTAELQRRVDVDLREEYSLLATLDAFDAQSAHSSVIRDSSDRPVPGLRSFSTSNLAQNVSMVGPVPFSMNNSREDLRSMVKSLHHARSRLKHYANEMDQICGAVVKFYNPSTPSDTDALFTPGDELQVYVKRSLELLLRIHRRTKAFFRGLEVTDDVTAREVIADLRSVIKMLNLGSGASPSSTDRSPHLDSTGDKENDPGSLVAPRSKERKPNSHAKRYYQRYRDLAQGLDTMTKECKRYS
ncbi:unnamed protein product [Echinostoma caproni]|uniref:DUF5741 domain-containing protein n=1 Tax=Echinostoma caproni TaxID=27848 RepID=A0A182ZZD7_9TREM|nr:unnamed protein product [Echinostoma caproni]